MAVNIPATSAGLKHKAACQGTPNSRRPRCMIDVKHRCSPSRTHQVGDAADGGAAVLALGGLRRHASNCEGTMAALLLVDDRK
jgi:hypothetical protein